MGCDFCASPWAVGIRAPHFGPLFTGETHGLDYLQHLNIQNVNLGVSSISSPPVLACVSYVLLPPQIIIYLTFLILSLITSLIKRLIQNTTFLVVAYFSNKSCASFANTILRYFVMAVCGDRSRITNGLAEET